MNLNIISSGNTSDITLYFIGIGGISMYGLAELSLNMGFNVAGSDNHPSNRTKLLQEKGITIHYEQVASNISSMKPDLIVKTAAIPNNNAELLAANSLNIPVIDRGEYLGWIADNYENVYSIAGTHGKTTTTALLATILLQADCKPTVHIGAELALFANNTIHIENNKNIFVTEACEYADSFLHLNSSVAVILNIDIDHLDYFHNLDNIIDSFVKFAGKIKPEGTLICPSSGKYLTEFKRRLAATTSVHNIITFGFDDIADYQATNIVFDTDGYPEFDVLRSNRPSIHIKLSIPGEHNILNALAAIAVSDCQQIPTEKYFPIIKSFHGAEGRFSIKGKFNGAMVVADYAHHPTATAATIQAANHLPHGHIWVVYQPLTFNRVEVFFEDYINALLPCEEILLYEIFSDREQQSNGISSKLLVDAINKAGGNAKFYSDYQAIKQRLYELAQPDDIILFLGPEEIRSFADKLVNDF